MQESLAVRVQAALNSAVRREIVTGAVVVASSGRSSVMASGGTATKHPSGSFDVNYAPRLACLLKPMVATIIHQLEEEGVLGLDDSVHKYLGEAECPSADSDRISLLQLLSHMSGLTDHALATSDASHGSDVSSILRRLDSLRVYWPPGELFSYSNLGYLILEAIIEKVCERDFLEVLFDRIFSPLEMADTVRAVESGANQLLDRGLRMTCRDVFNFVREFAKAESRLLQAGTIERMLSFKAMLPGFSQLYDSWSAGWARFGVETFGHNAICPDDGTRILARFVPMTGKAIVTVAQGRRTLPLLEDWCHAMIQLEAPRRKGPGALNECAAEDLQGVYWLQEGNFLQIRKCGSDLGGCLGAWPDGPADRVTVKPTSNSLLFVASDDGRPLGLFSFVRSRAGGALLWDGQCLHPRVAAATFRL